MSEIAGSSGVIPPDGSSGTEATSGSAPSVLTTGPPGQGQGDNNSTPQTISASGEPLSKKPRLEPTASTTALATTKEKTSAELLEFRLTSVLQCTVCLDLQSIPIYQCTNGHLMCSGCFTHLLADARLRDETSTCPNCRVEISKTNSSRNLAVEKAISELPAECPHCNKKFPRSLLENHQNKLCEERPTTCQYARIGCKWIGPFHERDEHETSCVHPTKTGSDIMAFLLQENEESEKEQVNRSKIYSLLSFEKIQFNDLQFKPYRTDEFIHKLYYETSRFTAFNHQWVVKAKINSKSQADPVHVTERQFEYQLILKSKPSTSSSSTAQSLFDVHVLVLKGPFGDMKLNPKIHQFTFSEQNTESPYFQLPLVDPETECNRLIAGKTIHLRLVLFMP